MRLLDDMLRIPYEETKFSEGSSDSRLQRAVLVWVEMCYCGKIVEPGRRFPTLLGFPRVAGSHVRVENWVAVAKDLGRQPSRRVTWREHTQRYGFSACRAPLRTVCQVWRRARVPRRIALFGPLARILLREGLA